MSISKSFYSDLTRARRAQRQERVIAAASFKVERITKSGQPSKMADDTTYYPTREAAQGFIDTVLRLNPGRSYNFRISEMRA